MISVSLIAGFNCCALRPEPEHYPASLQGRVADKSGAVLTKATVTATNTEDRTLKVDDV